MSKWKKVNVSQLVVGRRYFVECGIWTGKVLFVRCEVSKTRKYYRFTFADNVDDWKNDFGIIATKSKLKIFEGVE